MIASIRRVIMQTVLRGVEAEVDDDGGGPELV